LPIAPEQIFHPGTYLAGNVTQRVPQLSLGPYAHLSKVPAIELPDNFPDHRFKSFAQDIPVADKYPRKQHGVKRFRPSTKPALGNAEQILSVNEGSQVHFYRFFSDYGL
jgi:hypothetical protein